MSLCLTAGAKVLTVAVELFTLTWTHSVERTEWRETWAVENGELVLAEASVEGSGAGMEIPDGAVLRDGAWHYRPALPPQARVAFADAGRDGSDWTLCDERACIDLRDALPVVGRGFTMRACEDDGRAIASLDHSSPPER